MINKQNYLTGFLLVTVCALSFLTACSNTEKQVVNETKSKQPNIVIVVTDDQGYGDLGVHQNPIIQTPNIDDIAQQSARLTNFHVDPTCSPTRSALLTGKHSLNAGVWHTILGRYMLGPEHITLAESLQSNGYETAIFGKWHLGDNFPYRPQEQGFDEVLIHGGGGVGQTPDYWGNTQFDDTYYRNGKAEKFDGYATQIWFDEAQKFIQKPRSKPYFAYVALNAPHGPYRAPENYIEPYLEKGLTRTMASFYGMISHLDEQVGELRELIKSRGELDNTIFVFMTDNGSSMRQTDQSRQLTKDYAKLTNRFPTWLPNAGMRGYKGSVYEGGHRVPFFISYPNGGIKAGDYDSITAHFDVMPTILELAGIRSLPKDIDGASLVNYLIEEDGKAVDERSTVVTNQRVYHPSDVRPTVVAFQNWRYISENGEEKLYDLSTDFGQQINIIAKNPQITEKLRSDKLKWWQDAQRKGFKDRYIGVGNQAENPVRLNAMDWMEVPYDQPVPWFIGHQSPAAEWDYIHWLTEEDNYQPLPWYIDVERYGNYEIKAYFHDIPAATPVLKNYCVIDANGKTYRGVVHGRASHCVVNVPLNVGRQKIAAWFTDDGNTLSKQKAAFYLYLKSAE